MADRFLGFDHIDVRVRSLAAVEPFYDRLMPLLGLTRKRTAYVDASGDWHDATPGGGYNTVEYLEELAAEGVPHFIGFIEAPGTARTFMRLAFRVPPERLESLERTLLDFGALTVERSADMNAYPAIFFEDPDGTKLELVARPPLA